MQIRTDNESITAKQVVTKLIAQKSICADCGSKKSMKTKNSFFKLQKHAYIL